MTTLASWCGVETRSGQERSPGFSLGLTLGLAAKRLWPDEGGEGTNLLVVDTALTVLAAELRPLGPGLRHGGHVTGLADADLPRLSLPSSSSPRARMKRPYLCVRVCVHNCTSREIRMSGIPCNFGQEGGGNSSFPAFSFSRFQISLDPSNDEDHLFSGNVCATPRREREKIDFSTSQ